MKETNFSEKESLELIAQMIQQTKDNMKVVMGMSCCIMAILPY